MDRGAEYLKFGDLRIEFRSRDEFPLFGEPGLVRPTRAILFRTDDIAGDSARMSRGGLDLVGRSKGSVDESPGGMTMLPAAVVGNTALGLVERDGAPPERLGVTDGAAAHPNTATILERVYLAVESIDQELEKFEHVLGLPAPQPEMGTVIISSMSVFDVGGVGIAVAEPRGPGPTARALAANGPGLFQVLFRARHLDEAAASMVENLLPPPMWGTRLSGESALLVDAANACDLYVALAGPT